MLRSVKPARPRVAKVAAAATTATEMIGQQHPVLARVLLLLLLMVMVVMEMRRTPGTTHSSRLAVLPMYCLCAVQTYVHLSLSLYHICTAFNTLANVLPKRGDNWAHVVKLCKFGHFWPLD